MGEMMRWVSMQGWINVDRSMVYDKACAVGVMRTNVDILVDHMDRVYNALGDEQAAAMAGVLFADNGFTDEDSLDDWS